MNNKNPVRSFQKLQPKNEPHKSIDAQMDTFSKELNSSPFQPDTVIQVFIKHLSIMKSSQLSIMNIIKTGLREKYCGLFNQTTKKEATNQIIDLILEDILEKRNQKSNPSIFLKFIGMNNICHLDETRVTKILEVVFSKLNLYISCDKNIFFLLLKILKLSSKSISEEKMNAIYTKTMESLYLYFIELKNDLLRKDKETLMNYVSHFKILDYLFKQKLIENIQQEDQENLLQITINSLFIGSGMEESIFKSLEDFRKKIMVAKKENEFYFGDNKINKEKSNSEISSFSDYTNCVAQEKISEDLLKTLYIALSKFLSGIILKFGRYSLSKDIWQKIAGENYYLTSIFDFFKKVELQNSYFKDQKLRLDYYEEYFDNSEKNGDIGLIQSFLKRAKGV